MHERLKEIAERYAQIMHKLSEAQIDRKELLALSKERAQIEPLVNAYETLDKALKAQEENKELLNDGDSEIVAMAKEELSSLELQIEQLEQDIKVLLLPKDPDDDKNIILEIRAGTGGDEASLFAGELFSMYSRFADSLGFKVEILNTSEGTKGGFKEIVARIAGDQAYSWLKYEAGVHRVQRVPQTETQGRIHTSACSVAILPEAEEVDVKIEEKDLRHDVYRAGGPGGQSVNTTDSAVRVTHLPTGLVVQCQDEKSQHKNKARALSVLRARLYDKMKAEQEAERAKERKEMVKSGDRSDKIRTYNFPQDRCTDHRVGISMYNLPKLFSGDIKGLIEQIRAYFQAESLKGH